MPNIGTLPTRVRRALEKLGKDLRDARLRRRIPTSIMSERAFINRMTLYKIEKGDPGVAIGAYATILFVLGLEKGIADLADVRADSVGLALEEEQLPQRVRFRKPRTIPKSENK